MAVRAVRGPGPLGRSARARRFRGTAAASVGAALLALAAAAPPPLAAVQEQEPTPLFAAHDVVEVTLRADFSLLKGDRRGETPERPAVAVVWANESPQEIEAALRTRGRFRRDAANCTFPPLRIDFKKKQTAGTVFAGQDKLKIVGSCRPNRDSYEELVLREYLAYRIFQSVTATAFRVRLARITYEDTSGGDEPWTRFAFFIEDDDALAARLGGAVLQLPEERHLPPGALDPPTAATVAVFQYMIANTDWSDVAGHNVELVELMGIGLPVPYDFDFSGFVDAPYSTPDPTLGIKSVRERLYRGWCWPNLNVGLVLARFRDARPEIEALVGDFPHLDDGTRNRARAFLRPFFDAIETPERAERRFLRDCRPTRPG